jgi:hypothetical protein
MKQYLITEETLFQIIGEAEYKDRKDRVVWFTELSHPVEEIASGSLLCESYLAKKFVDWCLGQSDKSKVKIYAQKEATNEH